MTSAHVIKMPNPATTPDPIRLGSGRRERVRLFKDVCRSKNHARAISKATPKKPKATLVDVGTFLPGSRLRHSNEGRVYTLAPVSR